MYKIRTCVHACVVCVQTYECTYTQHVHTCTYSCIRPHAHARHPLHFWQIIHKHNTYTHIFMLSHIHTDTCMHITTHIYVYGTMYMYMVHSNSIHITFMYRYTCTHITHMLIHQIRRTFDKLYTNTTHTYTYSCIHTHMLIHQIRRTFDKLRPAQLKELNRAVSWTHALIHTQARTHAYIYT